jgi:hypothetical protein
MNGHNLYARVTFTDLHSEAVAELGDGEEAHRLYPTRRLQVELRDEVVEEDAQLLIYPKVSGSSLTLSSFRTPPYIVQAYDGSSGVNCEGEVCLVFEIGRMIKVSRGTASEYEQSYVSGQ